VRVLTKIYVCDDEPEILDMLHITLEQAGFEVHSFSSAAEALDEIIKDPCEILITDIRMDGINGFELAERVREIIPDCRTIVVTGCLSREETCRCMEHGVYACVSKPFKIDQIVGLVSRAVRELEPMGH
jgi:DNA-binding NtrC family response regulator